MRITRKTLVTTVPAASTRSPPAASTGTADGRLARSARGVAVGRSLPGVVALVLGLVACVAPEDNPAWLLAGHPGLLYQIKQYYERHGMEEGGRCTAPILEGATQTQVVDDGNDRLEVTLTYYYRDWLRDGGDCDRQRPLRCGVMRECRGFATRSFTVAKGDDGLQVIAMTGLQSGRP